MLMHQAPTAVGSHCLGLTEAAQSTCSSTAKKRQQGNRQVLTSAIKTHKRSDDEEQKPAEPSRRQIMLQSWNYAVMGTAIQGSNDATTVINSILGMYATLHPRE